MRVQDDDEAREEWVDNNERDGVCRRWCTGDGWTDKGLLLSASQCRVDSLLLLPG